MNATNSHKTLAISAPVILIAAGCLISLLGFGTRSVFGLFLEPMTAAHGWDRESFALAMAWQNLLWGLAVPFAGAVADRRGTPGIMVVGAMVYALGIWGMAEADSTSMLYWTAGVLCGLGQALTSFSLALAAMARVVGPERRSFALGIGTAAGSVGQIVLSPLTQHGIATLGWEVTLYLLAALILLIIPLGLLLPGTAAFKQEEATHQDLTDALREALHHRGYLLLTAGFFVCGFHVAFIVVHFPAYVSDLGLMATVGANAIALIGLFNIVGSFIAGLAGQRFRMRSGLCVIYALRALVITALLVAPMSATTIYLFAVAMGLLWLSTVPLTTGIVAQIFGVRYMATLFGVVFLSHQLGSFLGVWLGGRIYDVTGSYDAMWWAGVALSLVATALHWPIDERPVARLREA